MFDTTNLRGVLTAGTALVARRADLAAPSGQDDLRVQHLLSAPLLAVARADHPLPTARQRITRTAVAAHPLEGRHPIMAADDTGQLGGQPLEREPQLGAQSVTHCALADELVAHRVSMQIIGMPGRTIRPCPRMVLRQVTSSQLRGEFVRHDAPSPTHFNGGSRVSHRPPPTIKSTSQVAARRRRVRGTSVRRCASSGRSGCSRRRSCGRGIRGWVGPSAAEPRCLSRRGLGR